MSSAEDKLNESIFIKEIGIDFEWHEIDDLIMSDANILRPTVGYSFEFIVDEVFRDKLNINLFGGSGDTDVDKFFFKDKKKFTMQIKTPVKNSIKDGVSFNIQLHKTHGNETRPKNLYPIHFPCRIKDCKHEGEPFPDFLLAKHPSDGILIIPKDKLQESKNFPGHFADPQVFEWNSEYLNSWHYFGYQEYDGKNLIRKKITNVQEKFPKVSNIVNLEDAELIKIFIEPENFRLLHMNIRGNLREPFVKRMLEKNKIKLQEITESYPKFDVLTGNGFKIQIKGCSKHLSKIEKLKIGTEVMGTHRQGSGRRYSVSDFDYLCVVIDPKYIPVKIKLPSNKYNFFLIKSTSLPLHYKNKEWGTNDKVYENCKFKFFEKNNKVYVKPDLESYRISVKFGVKEVEINKIPSEICYK